MPKDKAGKFHMNAQRAMAADRMPAPKAPNVHEESPATPDSQDSAPSGGVPDHLSAMHAESGGKHMHVSGDAMGGYTSHHIGDGGNVEGPNDHENIEALKEHMGRFFDEESREPERAAMPRHHGMQGM